jgi:hypothetical protein
LIPAGIYKNDNIAQCTMRGRGHIGDSAGDDANKDPQLRSFT